MGDCALVAVDRAWRTESGAVGGASMTSERAGVAKVRLSGRSLVVAVPVEREVRRVERVVRAVGGQEIPAQRKCDDVE